MALRVIVVGAGIIGASIAFHLAERGAQVTVLEKVLPASGASSKSFGWINANFAESPAYYQLRREAISEFHAISEQLNLDQTVQWQGSLWWEDEGDALVQHAKELEDYGYEAEVLDTTAFAKLEPHVANPPERCIHGIIEGAADGAGITHLFLDRAAQNGANIISGCDVTGLLRKGGRITGVKTSFGDMQADHVVIAAGTWTEKLLAGDGIRLPMHNKTGVIVHTLPVPCVINHIVMAPDIHFRQDNSGRIIMGEIFSGGGLDQVKSETPDAFAQKMLARLRRRLPTVQDLQVEMVMVGTRPVPVDGFPVIGTPTDAPGLYIAAMHSGITLAPLVGKLAAMEIMDSGVSALLNDFRPTRF